MKMFILALFFPLLTWGNSPQIASYCQKFEGPFKLYSWGDSHCNDFSWNHVRNSVEGLPLIWATFGAEEKKMLNSTMILCGVHGDEITPVKFCFDIIDHLTKNKQLYENSFVIVAPLVNPDSFFKAKPSRTNAKGVDINRNFPSKDWQKLAIKYWKERFSSDKRRNPGTTAGSEPEVVFQVNLIKRYSPHKIISVHAPLTLLDYDGPLVQKESKDADSAKDAKQLLGQLGQRIKGIRVIDYPYFPGSLGNWAGKERNIPTFTLELPSSDPNLSKKFWENYREAIEYAIGHTISTGNLAPTAAENKK